MYIYINYQNFIYEKILRRMLKIMGNNYCQYMQTYFQTSLCAERQTDKERLFFTCYLWILHYNVTPTVSARRLEPCFKELSLIDLAMPPNLSAFGVGGGDGGVIYLLICAVSSLFFYQFPVIVEKDLAFLIHLSFNLASLILTFISQFPAKSQFSF